MKKDCVLIYDSGVGGISTLKEILKEVPYLNYVYFADDKNCPYGNKTEDEVFNLVCLNLKQFFRLYNIKLVILACNTITACCIEKLRQYFLVPFIGIEPAIKEAVKYSEKKNILTICTNLTKSQEKYKKLVKDINANVYTLSFENLANDIEKMIEEQELLDLSIYIKLLEPIIKENNIDCLVLGCTHYSFIKKELENALNIMVFDGNAGVRKQTKKVLYELGINNDGKMQEIILSSCNKNKEICYERLLNS